jgi:alkylation response protein AidB-like acyl-CoA dehydrogenase
MDSLFDIVPELSAQFAESASQHDSSGIFPDENFAKLYDKGLMSLTVARSAGGCGATLEQSRRVVSELAKGDGSTALAFAMHVANHAVIANGHWWPPCLAKLVTETNRAQVALINRLQVEPQGGGTFLWSSASDSCGVRRGRLANNGPEVLCYRSPGADMAFSLRIYE